MSVIHLHPSVKKPHVIIQYKDKNGKVFPNEIFIRSGSSTLVASKSDLDKMYIERANIIVERKAVVGIRASKCSFGIKGDDTIFFIAHLSIENLGYRPLGIDSIIIRMKSNFYHRDFKDFTCICELIDSDPRVIPQNEIRLWQQRFFYGHILSTENEKKRELAEQLNSLLKQNLITFESIEFKLSNGAVFFPDLEVSMY